MKQRIRTSVKQSISTRFKVAVVLGSGMVVIGLVFLLVFGLNLTSKNARANDEMATTYWSLENVTPSDFRSSVDVSIDSKINCLLLVKLYTENDELIAKEVVQLKEGSNVHHLTDLEMLPAGNYVVEVSGEDKSVKRTINKK